MIGGVLQGIIKIRGTNIAASEAKTLVGGGPRAVLPKSLKHSTIILLSMVLK